MSIWSALWDRKIEPRNKYGDDDDSEPTRYVYVSRSSPTLSSVLRVSIDEDQGVGGRWRSAEAYMTPDECREFAAALIEAADRLSEPTGATLTPSEAPTGTGGADNESEAL